MPEWTAAAFLVMVMATLAMIWFRQTCPDRAAALEARLEAWLEPYRPALNLLGRMALVVSCLVAALVVGLFAWLMVGCWLEGCRARGKLPAPGPGGGEGAGVQDPVLVPPGDDEG